MIISCIRWRWIGKVLLLSTWLCLIGSVGMAAEQASDKTPVLLVHGMAWDVERPKPVWGSCEKDDLSREKWTGMISFLDHEGYRFGGTLRPVRARLDLPECLDKTGAKVDTASARLFALEFSPGANADGLAQKGLELAEAIKQVCRLTGSKKVNLVAHSAGGLASRAYVQRALPGVTYRGDVDRLITIGTPHLGTDLASKMGDLIGTRATSLKHDAPLITQLNQELDFPKDVRFASIVVRGFSADVQGKGSAYEKMVDRQLVERLPIDYREGGDQVVHVLSQNLRLVPRAAMYEQATGKPIQYLLARVKDPSSMPAGRRVHSAAPFDEKLQQMVEQLLEEDFFWNTAGAKMRIAWMVQQARLHAISAIETKTLDEHSASEVKRVELTHFKLIEQKKDVYRYAFSGRARSANRVMPLRRRWTKVQGTIELTFDSFGRVIACRIHEISDRS